MSRRPRKAISVIETLVVTLLATVVLGLVGTSLVALARVDRRFDRLAEARGDLPLLANRLRRDLRAADRVRFGDGVLRIESPTGDVSYQLLDGRAERLAEGATARFRLPAGAHWDVSLDRLRDRRLVVLRFAGAPTAEGESGVLLELVAEVGRDLRLVAGGRP